MTTGGPPKGETINTEPDWFKYGWQISLGVVVAFVVLALLQFTAVATAQWIVDARDVSAFGISGDFFGAINALFSALAFAAIIITLWMQKYELSQQREELQTTRNVMKQQQFEATFFRMLELHGSIVDGIPGNRIDSRGRQSIDSLVKLLFDKLGQDGAAEAKTAEQLVKAYNDWYESYESEIGHYFRTLYNLVRYVDDFGGDDKHIYARLVRAQLSSNELELLLLNCLGEHGREKFKPLVEKYRLLKHLKYEPFHQVLIDRYNDSAFAQRNG